MPLTEHQQMDLLRVAKSHWVDAQGYKYAYEREFKSSKSMSGYLKRGTFVAAVLTAGATALQEYVTLWPGVIAALCTGITSAFDQVFAPVQSAQDYWKCRNGLEEIQRELVSYAITIDAKTELADGMKPLNAMAKRMSEITLQRQFVANVLDTKTAENEFSRSAIFSIINRLEHPIRMVEDEETPTEMGYDAPDVVAAARGAVQRAGNTL